MSHHDYSLEELRDITPYENYINAIKDKVTKKKYAGQLEMFLNPDYDWDKSQQKRKLLPDNEFAILVNDFVDMIKKDPAFKNPKANRSYFRKR
ncbi:MAG: hypothetical protein OEM28_00765 [Nitrosopumilus sp.]|nr:hypothetical protein [Nitrosopumilus sp.]MDH3487262.1 hypothetical protein [Nitrosopumilus sp.]